MMPFLIGLLLTANINPQVLTVPITPYVDTLTTSDLMAIATSSAAKYHLTKKQTRQMLATINCESGWDIDAVGGMGEIGLVQVYPPAHTDITKDQMKDPYFILPWMAKQWSLGNQGIWSCFSLLYGQS